MKSVHVEAKDVEAEYIESTLLGIQELKNDLVTQIAHNFRTPLTSVIGFAEMLLADRPLTDEQRIEYARFIQYEGIRLSKLIDDVLELSSLERGDSQLRIRDCVLQEVVADAISRVAEFARGRFVRVTRNFADLPVSIRVDREKIAEAVYQLLHNAVRFTKLNDEVTVTMIAIGDSVEIAVRDGGPGITEDEIVALFDRISTRHIQEQDPHSTGVGLAIVKHIMDLHKGKIQIQSKKSEGSLFTLCIPGNQE